MKNINLYSICFVTACQILFIVVFGFHIPPTTHAQSPALGIINGYTYTIYGGNNPDDSLSPDWTPGSDNVVWDFGQTKMVYRLIKSLSLKYNPGGEFHISRASTQDISKFKYLSFTGRAADEGLDFSITFINKDNQPVGAPLKFSNFGGVPQTNYWTQYNFPISSFLLPVNTISGIRISQLSSKWLAVVYLDEIYLSDLRGEEINPAIATPTPTPDPNISPHPLEDNFFPELNPLIFIIPFAVLIIAMFFH